MEKKTTVIIFCPQTGETKTFTKINYETAYALLQDAEDNASMEESANKTTTEDIKALAELRDKLSRDVEDDRPGTLALDKLNAELEKNPPIVRDVFEKTVGVSRLSAFTLEKITDGIGGIPFFCKQVSEMNPLLAVAAFIVLKRAMEDVEKSMPAGTFNGE